MKTHTSSSPRKLKLSPPWYSKGIVISEVKKKLCISPSPASNSSAQPMPSMGKYFPLE